jgi:Phage integrase family
MRPSTCSPTLLRIAWRSLSGVEDPGEGGARRRPRSARRDARLRLRAGRRLPARRPGGSPRALPRPGDDDARRVARGRGARPHPRPVERREADHPRGPPARWRNAEGRRAPERGDGCGARRHPRPAPRSAQRSGCRVEGRLHLRGAAVLGRGGRGRDGALALLHRPRARAPSAKDEQRITKRLARAFARVLRRAGLADHFTPKSLRHTFGSQLISRGFSPAFVQQQMGHASIQLTVDTYGSWLPIQAPGAVDALADAVLAGPDSSRMVAAGGFEASGGR